MIYVLKKTISVSFLSEISAVRKDRFTPLSDFRLDPPLERFIYESPFTSNEGEMNLAAWFFC